MATTHTITESVRLEYTSGTSDKVYHARMEHVGANHFVKVEYGRRGSTLNHDTKCGPTHDAAALKIYEKLLKEKLSKGYRPANGSTTIGILTDTIIKDYGFASRSMGPYTTTTAAKGTRLPDLAKTIPIEVSVCQLLNSITGDQLSALIKDDDWVLQEKHDGKRMQMQFDGGDNLPMCWNRKGLSIEPPREFAACCKTYFSEFNFKIDGEAVGDTFYAFDILMLLDQDLKSMPLEDRLLNLGMLIRSTRQDTIRLVYTAETTRAKMSMLKAVMGAKREGVCAKDKNKPYTPGRPNSGGPALKFKFVESATCVVTAHSDKRSVFIAMSGVKGMIDVGKVSIPVNHPMPKVDQIIEVEYLYAYPEGSLYQPVYKGVRDDVPVDEVDKLKFKSTEVHLPADF